MWVFNIAAIAPDPDLLATDRAWVRSFWEALLPYASSAGGYVNFQNDVDDERVRESYGAAKYARLARVKAAKRVRRRDALTRANASGQSVSERRELSLLTTNRPRSRENASKPQAFLTAVQLRFATTARSG